MAMTYDCLKCKGWSDQRIKDALRDLDGPNEEDQLAHEKHMCRRRPCGEKRRCLRKKKKTSFLPGPVEFSRGGGKSVSKMLHLIHWILLFLRSTGQT